MSQTSRRRGRVNVSLLRRVFAPLPPYELTRLIDMLVKLLATKV